MQPRRSSLQGLWVGALGGKLPAPHNTPVSLSPCPIRSPFRHPHSPVLIYIHSRQPRLSGLTLSKPFPLYNPSLPSPLCGRVLSTTLPSKTTCEDADSSTYTALLGSISTSDAREHGLQADAVYTWAISQPRVRISSQVE